MCNDTVCWQHVVAHASQKTAHAAAKKRAPLRAHAHPHDENEGEESLCAICLGNLNEKEKKTVVLQCNHTYHIECVGSWFENDKDTCPVCRDRVSRSVMMQVAPARVAREDRHAMQSAFLLRLLLEAADFALP